MDKATFEHLVSTPNSVSENEAMLLEDLAQAFPYCQSAHLLLAKESQQKKSMLFPKKLRKASTYILDRKVLHRLLHAQENPIPQPPVIPEPQKNELEQVQIATTKNISILQELEETLRETRERKKMYPITKDTEPILPPTQAEINEPQKNDSNAINQGLFYRSESRLGEELCVSTIDKASDTTTLFLFLDYLKSRATKPSVIAQEETSKSQVNVIEKFLETEPKITRPIASMLSNEETNDLSKDSTELKIELTTENYAQILVKQNKIEKAKEVYKKLMLKYPDKSTYFAAKLNELENR
jgi:hypothetical protein